MRAKASKLGERRHVDDKDKERNGGSAILIATVVKIEEGASNSEENQSPCSSVSSVYFIILSHPGRIPCPFGQP